MRYMRLFDIRQPGWGAPLQASELRGPRASSCQTLYQTRSQKFKNILSNHPEQAALLCSLINFVKIVRSFVFISWIYPQFFLACLPLRLPWLLCTNLSSSQSLFVPRLATPPTGLR